MALHHLLARADGQAGSNRNQDQSSSLSAIISTLVPTLIIAVVFVTLFLIFRRKFRRVYAPRTYIDSLGEQRRTPPTSPGLFGWVKDFRSIKDEYILDHQSIDGYLFVRYFKLIIIISFLGCLVCMPVLFPINATGGGVKKQLDILGFGNIAEANYVRYYAHSLVSCVFLGLVMILIARESFYAVNIRQAYRRSPWGASRLSSRTILFTNVPKNLTEATLFEMFPGVKHAWIASNCKDLQELVDDRDKTAMKLEQGEIQLSRAANDNRMKAAKGKKKVYQSGEGVDKFCNPKDRATHRLKFLIGKKVDSVTYGRSHLAELLPKIEAEQDKHWSGKGDVVGAVFLEFTTQRAAQDAWQLMQTRKTKPNSKLSARQLGVTPQEVVWNNLRIGTAEHWIRWAIAVAIISVVIIFFAIPVAFIGAISHVDALAVKYSWLSWILKIPSVILGVVTGLLPVVLLAVLMALVPIFCRLLANKLAGHVTLSQVELQTQSWYFAFQVIQVFLVTTCAGAVTSVIAKILDDPGSALNLLAENLPTASNFYISYFILFGLSSAAGTLLNIGGFVVVVLLGRILPGKTPRAVFSKLITLTAPAWGSEYPKWVNLGVIALSYSGIAPLVLAFSFVGFCLIYVAFRYNFLYCYETNIDTQGEAYAKALRQLMTGVFLSEICLIGLFAIATASRRSALGPLIIEVVLLAVTILFTISLKSALTHYEARIAYEDPVDTPNVHIENGVTEKDHANGTNGTNGTTPKTSSSPVAQPRKSRIPPFIQKIINPEKNSVANLSTRLDRFYHTPQEPLPLEIQKRAFFNPAVTSPTPILWIVRDEMGISAREIADTKKAVPAVEITDAQATFNEKGKVQWDGLDEGQARAAPVWEEKIVY